MDKDLYLYFIFSATTEPGTYTCKASALLEVHSQPLEMASKEKEEVLFSFHKLKNFTSTSWPGGGSAHL